jgi:hypothetical protein
MSEASAIELSRHELAALDPAVSARLEGIIAATMYYTPVWIGTDAQRGGPHPIQIGSWLCHNGPLKRSSKAMRAAAAAMVERMVAMGRLVVDADRLRLCSPPDDGLDARGRAAIYRRNLAKRLLPHVGAQVCDRLAEVFHIMRTAERATSTDDGSLELSRDDCRAVAWPVGIHMGADGAFPQDVSMLVVRPSGMLSMLRAAPDRSVHRTVGDCPHTAVDIEGLRSDRSGLRETVVSILPRIGLTIPRARFSFDWEGVEAFVGTQLAPRARKSFAFALERTPRATGYACARLAAILDKEAVRACARALPSSKLAQYQWFCPPLRRSARYRRQSAAVLPFMTNMVMQSDALTGLVDSGRSVMDYVAQSAGISKVALRHIGHRHWQQTGSEVYKVFMIHPASVGRALGAVPPERMPRNKKEWKAFLSALTLVNSLANRLDESWHDEAEVNSFVASSMSRLSQDWPACLLQTRDACQTYADMSSDVVRSLEAAIRQKVQEVLGGEMDHYLLRSVVEKTALHPRGVTLRSILQAAVEWHRQAPMLARRISEIGHMDATRTPVDGTWPAADADWTGADGSSLTWLTHRAALKAESDEMHHCVWSYGHSCLLGGSHIAAVRGASGGRSTVEMRLARLEGCYKLQHDVSAVSYATSELILELS